MECVKYAVAADLQEGAASYIVPKTWYMMYVNNTKDNRGEEITRMIDAQWISRIFEATHLDGRANRVQVTPCIDPWGCATIGWVKNRMIEKYQAMKANGEMIATDDKIKLKAYTR
jgi:hypothetical protein